MPEKCDLEIHLKSPTLDEAELEDDIGIERIQKAINSTGLFDYMKSPKMKHLSLSDIKSLSDEDLEAYINGDVLEDKKNWTILTSQDLRSEMQRRYFDKGSKSAEKITKRSNLIALISLAIATLSLAATLGVVDIGPLKKVLPVEASDSSTANLESELIESTQ